jgi:uncharacterized integral membrane protein
MADHDVHHVDEPGGRQLSPRQLVVLTLAALLVLFAALNFHHADVHLLFTTVSMPLVFVIAFCTLIGFAAGYLFAVHLGKQD